LRGRKNFEPPGKGELEKFLVTGKELAHVLEVSERTIRNFVQSGLPRRNDKRFDLVVAVRWHVLVVECGLRQYWDALEEDD